MHNESHTCVHNLLKGDLFMCNLISATEIAAARDSEPA